MYYGVKITLKKAQIKKFKKNFSVLAGSPTLLLKNLEDISQEFNCAEDQVRQIEIKRFDF